VWFVRHGNTPWSPVAQSIGIFGSFGMGSDLDRPCSKPLLVDDEGLGAPRLSSVLGMIIIHYMGNPVFQPVE